MIILEFFMVALIIALIVFGKIEFIWKRKESFFFKLSLVIFGKQYPMITINTNTKSAER
jgi:hypothetical protein